MVGGTSAACPEFAGSHHYLSLTSHLPGMISLINDALLNAGEQPLGFLNPALYALNRAAPGKAFFDITAGTVVALRSFTSHFRTSISNKALGSTRCGSSDCTCSEGFAASQGYVECMHTYSLTFFLPQLGRRLWSRNADFPSAACSAWSSAIVA